MNHLHIQIYKHKATVLKNTLPVAYTAMEKSTSLFPILHPICLILHDVAWVDWVWSPMISKCQLLFSTKLHIALCKYIYSGGDKGDETEEERLDTGGGKRGWWVFGEEWLFLFAGRLSNQ